MSYNPSMTEMIENIIADTSSRRFPKKIKVKPYFYNYLAANFTDDLVHNKDDSPQGYYSAWTGIPVEIDDTIENEYYELVY